MDAVNRVKGVSIRVRGLVQGVGFRPTVWRIAKRLGLTGNVLNDNEGVLIHAFGYPAAIDKLEFALVSEAPPLARIESIETAPLPGRPPVDFRILHSRGGAVTTGVVPDAATCAQCRADIRDPSNRRYRYPFTNCTLCGPRLSILKAIPYDRASTSMAAFPLCADCVAEYRDPSNRRFHAQPNACPVCGPRAWLEDAEGRAKPGAPYRDAVEAAAALIASGAIVAIKGLGGFHLACDARNGEAVARLRNRKHRIEKPFALMARDAGVIERYATLSDTERALLAEPAAPIVLLNRDENGASFASGVAPAQSTLGFMLPYTPLHHILFEDIDYPLVMTSGNRSDEPQCIANEEARAKLAGIADAFLMHDRDIVNRLDDSVARVMAENPRLLRRARGCAPSPLTLPEGFGGAPRILAMGAELKSTFCLLGDGRATVSQHIGDLEDAATHADYRANQKLYQEIFRFEPDFIAVDAHPEYHSTQWGRVISQEQGLAIETVHHHHAHVAAVLAEHEVPLATGPVIGIALDGLGFGERGELWGGEFLLGDYRACRRVASFTPVPLIGGEKAMREPWRSALAHLHAFLGWDHVASQYGTIETILRLQQKPVATAIQIMERGVNAPPSSSAGRLFDAVAALLGICFDTVSYEGQAAIELEALAAPAMHNATKGYRGTLVEGASARLDWTPLWNGFLRDLATGTDAPLMAARFHLGLAESLAETAASLARSHACKAIVLSGGVFQNKLLFEGVNERLTTHGVEVLTPSIFPAGDGGISLGQAVIAAARRLP